MYESNNQEDYVFFWKIDQDYSWGSQWYKSPFTARIQMTIDGKSELIDSGREVTFATAEHWMMACKALLFSDTDIFEQIISSTDTSSSDLRTIKALGRQVSNFDNDVWEKYRMEIVIKGNEFKFRQNEELRKALLDTGSRTIVEASPMDRIWGIGFGEKNALKSRRGGGRICLGWR